MNLRFATPEDLADLVYLEKICNPHPWSQGQLQEAINNNYCLLACEQGDVVGMLIWQQVLDEAEIYLINTLPEKQRQGIASRLLNYLKEYSLGMPILKIFLEVRADNVGAQTLYLRNGFVTIATRKNYYTNTDGSFEHALIMEYIDAR